MAVFCGLGGGGLLGRYPGGGLNIGGIGGGLIGIIPGGGGGIRIPGIIHGNMRTINMYIIFTCR
jgi:hypothetical protein